MISYTSRTKFDDKIFVKMKGQYLIEKPANSHYKFSFIIDFTLYISKAQMFWRVF